MMMLMLMMTPDLLLGPLGPRGHRVVVLVLVHHAEHADGRAVGAAVGLQQLVVLRAQLVPHLPRGRHQLVLHQRRVLVVRLDVVLAEGRLANQTRRHRPLPAAGAEVAHDVPGPGLVPGLVPGQAPGLGVGPAGLTHAAVAVQVQGARVGHGAVCFSRAMED